MKMIVGVDDAEGPTVPIPNTEVKLSGADDSGRATYCENREMPILVVSFLFYPIKLAFTVGFCFL